MTERRRYRYLDAATLRLGGRAAVEVMRWGGAARVLAGPTGPAALERRHEVVREALGRADMIVTPSPYVRYLLHEQGLAPERVRLIAHGLAVGPEAAAARDDVPPPLARRFAYLGQVIAPKGLHLLLRAFRRLRRAHGDATLQVFGGDAALSYEQRLRGLAGEAEGVYWHGRYAPEEVWRILRGVDVVIVPSLWREIGPMVMLEALAAGRPVVASDLPNMNYVVRHGENGLLFRPGSVRDLARQLCRLSDEEGLVARLRRRIGLPRTMEREMEELTAVYGRLAAGRQVQRESAGVPEPAAGPGNVTACRDSSRHNGEI